MKKILALLLLAASFSGYSQTFRPFFVGQPDQTAVVRGWLRLPQLSDPGANYLLSTDADGTLQLTLKSGVAGWSLTGNTGTTPGTNFIGTTDNKGLMFKVNNVQSGYISVSSNSTSFGMYSQPNTSIGTNNAAFGFGSLSNNTNGSINAALGSFSLYNNTTGLGNTAAGYYALTSNTTGYSNTAVGTEAMFNNTTGKRSTAIGRQAKGNSINDSDFVAIGHSANAISNQMAISDSIKRLKFKGLSKGGTTLNYVLTDTTGNGDICLKPVSSGGSGVDSAAVHGISSPSTNVLKFGRPNGDTTTVTIVSNDPTPQIADTAAAIRSLLLPSAGIPGSVIYVGSTGRLQQSNGNFNFDSTNKILKITTPTSANTYYPSFVAQNTATASSGNQMYGGYYYSEGQGWKTNATAASQSVAFRWGTLPVQGSSAPTGTWELASSINGGSFTNRFTVASTGAFTAGGSGVTSAITGNLTVASGSITFSNSPQINFTNGTGGISYRLINGGSSLSANEFTTNKGVTTSGTVSYNIDAINNNGFTGVAANSGGQYIARTAVMMSNLTNTAGSESGDLSFYTQSGGTAMTEKLRITSGGGFVVNATNTAGGTTGNQTINKPSGTVNIAAAGTSVTVTNSLVTTSSIVFAVIRTNDATAKIKNVVPGAGSFTINLDAAATAEVSIGFFVIN